MWRWAPLTHVPGTNSRHEWRIKVNVLDVARAMGLDVTNGEVTGTIDEKNVLDALADLAENDPENDDLFGAAAARVQRARSAGVEEFDAGSILSRPNEVATTQLRYRSEMADIFVDLAIDVGLRHHRKLVPAA
jgi:hypothetical protein